MCALSIPIENPSKCRLKISPLLFDCGLQLQPIGVKMKPAGEAVAGSAGEQPAKEYPAVRSSRSGSSIWAHLRGCKAIYSLTYEAARKGTVTFTVVPRLGYNPSVNSRARCSHSCCYGLP